MTKLLQEKRIIKEKKGKSAFDKSKVISDYNKRQVHNFVEDISVESVSSDRPYNYNGTRYLAMKIFGEKLYPNKPFDQITNEDVRNTANKLRDDEAKNDNGNPYSKSYKKTIFKVINSFYEYLFGSRSDKFISLFLTRNGKQKILC